MSLWEIIKLLLMKFDISKDKFNILFDSMMKIPSWLKHTLIAALVIGGVYYGYQKMYQTEIDDLKTELTELREALAVSVNSKDYSNDIFYLISAIKTTEAVQKYAYEEEQLQLDLIYTFLKKNFPNDPILYDIDAMKKRNEHNYIIYHQEFEKAIQNCKNIYILSDK